MSTKKEPEYTFYSRAKNGIVHVKVPEIDDEGNETGKMERRKLQFRAHEMVVTEKAVFEELVKKGYTAPTDEDEKPPKPKWPASK